MRSNLILSLKRPRRHATRLAVAAALVLTCGSSYAALAQTAAAATTANGTVMCIDQRSVEGVWITAASGGSGWAGWSGGYYAGFSYRLPNGGAYKVTVGCGGSPQHWASSSTSRAWVTGYNNFSCYDFAYEGGYWCQVT